MAKFVILSAYALFNCDLLCAGECVDLNKKSMKFQPFLKRKDFPSALGVSYKKLLLSEV